MASVGSHGLDHYAERFAHLHTDRSRRRWPPATDHRAPHKMLLLPGVMDLIDRGECTDGSTAISPRLPESFADYWSAIMPQGTRGDIRKPLAKGAHRTPETAVRPHCRSPGAGQFRRCVRRVRYCAERTGPRSRLSGVRLDHDHDNRSAMASLTTTTSCRGAQVRSRVHATRRPSSSSVLPSSALSLSLSQSWS